MKGVVRLAVAMFTLAIMALAHPPATVRAGNDLDCYITYSAAVYDYSNNQLNYASGTDYSPNRTSDVDCASNFGQNDLLTLDDNLCDGQGFESSGQGYASDSYHWDYTDADGIWRSGDVGPQQYDCADV